MHSAECKIAGGQSPHPNIIASQTRNSAFCILHSALNYNLYVTNLTILLSSLSVAKDLKMATHKTFPNEILRCRSRMTRLEMLTTNYNLKNRIWASYSQIIIKLTSMIAENYNLKNLLWALHLQIIIKTKISDNWKI